MSSDALNSIHNYTTFQYWNVGDKVRVIWLDGRAAPDFGWVQGFQYNSTGEMILALNLVGKADPVLLFPTNTATHQITRIRDL
jgi:hypothetical protein